MSREVTGLAPDDAVVGQGPDAPIPPPRRPGDDLQPPAPATTARSGRSARSGRTVTLATLAVAVLVSAAFGWSSSGAWSAARSRESVMRGAAAAATLLDAGASADGTGDLAVSARVRVSNVGTLPVTVSGFERTFLAARIDRLTPVPTLLGEGRSVDLEVLAHVDCGSPLQLSLPALTLRRPDGVLRPLPIDGAAGELVRLCDRSGTAAHTLKLLGVAIDERRLRVVLVVPSGRTVRIAAAAAGDVALTGHPIPGAIDGQSRTVWLDPPAGCPVSWRTQGLPLALDLTVDGTMEGVGRAHVVVDIGYRLADWLLATSCSGRS